jgi:uncharacterized membrane protein
MKENSNHNEGTVPSVLLSEQIATIKAELTVHAVTLPPPETVERYESVQPGAFDRILTMAENDQRDKIEHNGRFLKVFEHDNRTYWTFALRGQLFGFVVVVMYFVILGMTVWFNNVTMFCVVFTAGAIAGLPPLVRAFQNKNGGTSGGR